MTSFLKNISILLFVAIPAYVLFITYSINKNKNKKDTIDPSLTGVISIENIYSLPEVIGLTENNFDVNKTGPSDTVNDIIIYNVPYFKLMITTQNVSDQFILSLQDIDGNKLNNLEYKSLTSKLIEAKINVKDSLKYNEQYFLILEDNKSILNKISLFISSEAKKV